MDKITLTEDQKIWATQLMTRIQGAKHAIFILSQQVLEDEKYMWEQFHKLYPEIEGTDARYDIEGIITTLHKTKDEIKAEIQKTLADLKREKDTAPELPKEEDTK